jgi:hypothetical protein
LPVIGPSEALALDLVDGRIERIVLKDHESTYWPRRNPR